jgi:hypothetical protein
MPPIQSPNNVTCDYSGVQVRFRPLVHIAGAAVLIETKRLPDRRDVAEGLAHGSATSRIHHMRRVLRGFAPARPQRGPERAGTPIGDGYCVETSDASELLAQSLVIGN